METDAKTGNFLLACMLALLTMVPVIITGLVLSHNGIPLFGSYSVVTPERVAAAEQGDAAEQNNLGAAYHEGLGVPQDYAQAVKWYRRAAEQGNADAQYNLGLLYRSYGADASAQSKHNVLAYHWFNLAGAQGLGRAKNANDRLRSSMTAAQIDEAQKLSREFKPKIDRHGSSFTSEGERQ